VVLKENGEDKMVRESTNKEVLEHRGEKRTLFNNRLHIPGRTSLLPDATEGQTTEVKGVATKRLNDDLCNKEEIESLRRKLNMEICGNDSLSIEHKEDLNKQHI
jgi:hypothetical protein